VLKLSWPLAAAFVIGAAALTVSPGVVTAELALCVAWALVGPRQAIQALAVSVLITYANPALVTFGTSSGALARLVLIAAALRVLPTMRQTDLSLLWPVWLFSLTAALVSWISSPALAISVMKIITFTLATTTILVAFGRLTPRRLEQLQTWISTLVLVVVGLSLLTLIRPSVAFHRTHTGLQGVLGHPQALAVVLAPAAAWLLSSLTLMKGRLGVWTLIVVGTVCIAMLMTEARTAAVAATAGLALAALRALRGTRRDIGTASFGRLMAFAAVGLVAIAIAGLTTDKVSEATSRYLFKRSGAEDISGAFYKSRGGGILSQWQNFLNAPLTGHGFGVYANGKFPAGVTEFAGIPISAPVEKGFVPTAVLEETGVFGGLAFLFVIVRLARVTWRGGDPRLLALFGACAAVNAGEAVILAPGGIGMFLWILIGLAIAASRIKPKTATATVTAPAFVGMPIAAGASAANPPAQSAGGPMDAGHAFAGSVGA